MEALKAKGNEAFKKGNFAVASSFYKRALEAAEASLKTAGSEEACKGIRRDCASIHSNLSCALMKQGNVAEALSEAEKCTECRPEWHKGWYRKGEALFAQGEYEGAEVAYHTALDLEGGKDQSLKKSLMLALEGQQGFFFRQMFPGREFCSGATSSMIENQINAFAKQMRNFVYLVGDARTREVVVVDGAWDVEGVMAFAEAEKVKVVGAVVTHHHTDHAGGIPPPPFDIFGVDLPGAKDLAVKFKLPVYVHKADAGVLRDKIGVPAQNIRELQDNSCVEVGSVKLKFIHTPGHTPGSQCIHIERASGFDQGLLISGDTLFIGRCGSLDPDCEASSMKISLQQKLSQLPDLTRVYPGHDYGGSFTTIGKEKMTGLLRPMTEEEWERRVPKK